MGFSNHRFPFLGTIQSGMPLSLLFPAIVLLLLFLSASNAFAVNGERVFVSPSSRVTWDDLVIVDQTKAASADQIQQVVPFMHGPPAREIEGPEIQPASTDSLPIPDDSPNPLTPTLSANFQALPDNNTRIPPDTHGAVGENHVMTMLNSQVRIQTKTGEHVSTVSLPTFWAPAGGSGEFDPRLVYDQEAGRWIATCDSDRRSASSSVLFAISDTSNPTGTWTFYRIDADPTDTDWADFPDIGFNTTWIAITNNMFTNAADSWSGNALWVIDKSTALAGGALTLTFFPVGSDNFGGFQGGTLRVCHTFGLEPKLYIVDNPVWRLGGRGLLRLTEITGTASVPVWSATAGSNLPGAGWFYVDNNFDWAQINAPQLDTSVRIDTNDARMLNAVYRNGQIWCIHSAGLPVGDVDRTAVCWYQLNPTALPEPIVQSGVLDGGSDVHHFFPSITANANGDAFIGFSRSDATRYVEAVYTGRSASDPPGTMAAISLLKAGEDSYEKNFGLDRIRWGDYSATVIDPVDDLTFWTIQEYAALDTGPNPSDDRWGTWWGKVSACENDTDCGTCEKCVSNACELQTSSEDIKDDCLDSEVCLTGYCDGAGACGFEPDTTECRTAAGDCDLTEYCTGSSADCPADAKSTAECRVSGGVCDPAEICDGISDDCPADDKSTAECRVSGGVCDPAEICDGINDDCPADAKSTAECRVNAGVCDPAEVCDGINNDCPADLKSTAECRMSGGVCDPAEVCDGINNDCPADLKSRAECRMSGGVCDPAEVCDGINDDCPADAKSTAECRVSGGVCDPAEICDGINDDCPADAKSTAECRVSGGVCDPAEICDGINDDCPADDKSTAECRMSGGVCDPAEVCDGINDDCPADAKSTAECRMSGGVCDPAEICDGINDDCPADAKSTAECRVSGGVCDPAEICDGINDDCPADELHPSPYECRASTEECDPAEYCSGSNVNCPTDYQITYNITLSPDPLNIESPGEHGIMMASVEEDSVPVEGEKVTFDESNDPGDAIELHPMAELDVNGETAVTINGILEGSGTLSLTAVDENGDTISDVIYILGDPVDSGCATIDGTTLTISDNAPCDTDMTVTCEDSEENPIAGYLIASIDPASIAVTVEAVPLTNTSGEARVLVDATAVDLATVSASVTCGTEADEALVAISDTDADGVPDAADNCPDTPNQDQDDFFPPGGNDCGNACECEGNFDDDENVDGSDASVFKSDFGRGTYNNPCADSLPCNGNFDCDNDVDGSDASVFKSDFGRGSYDNPCPSCPTDPWCVSP